MKVKFNLEKREYKTIPEGERILEITNAECKPSGKPDRMEVSFKDIENEGTCKSKFSFSNDGAMFAMAMLCQKALDLPDMSEFDTSIDTKKLIGKFLKCEVVHTEGNTPNQNGELPIFANIKKVLERVEVSQELTQEQVNQVNTVLTGDISPRASIGSDL